jgi:hypothetical protein
MSEGAKTAKLVNMYAKLFPSVATAIVLYIQEQ